MPTTRKLTQPELDYLQQQGVDVTQLKDGEVNILSPDEIADQQTQQQGVIRGAIAPTLKAHAGSLIGGGLAGTAGWTGAAALAPETGGLSFVIPALAAAATSMIGSKLGDVAQKKGIEPLVMSPEQQQQEEEAAESARRVYPKTSVGTDLVAGMIAGGGRPSIRAPLYAARGIGEGFANSQAPLLSIQRAADALTKTSNPIYKQAIQNVVTGNALNTAINAGVQIATTGKVDPMELAGAAVVGSAMAEPSALGRKLNPKWKPLDRVTETPSVAESIDPSGENIADVEAYKKSAQKTTDDLLSQHDAYRSQQRAYEAMMAQQEQAQVEAQSERQRLGEQQKLWTAKDADGNYVVDDDTIAKEYLKANRINPKKGATPAESVMLRQQNAKLADVPVEQMRSELFEQGLQKYNPEAYADLQYSKQQQFEAARKAQQEFQDALRQRQADEQQRKDEFAKAEEERRQQAQEEMPAIKPQQPNRAALMNAIGEPIPVAGPQQPKPLNENALRIINAEKLKAGMEGGVAQPREGRNLYQEAEGGEPGTATPELLAEAGKAATHVGEIEGQLFTPSGAAAKGVAYAPENVGRRLIGLVKGIATNDTGYHELVHTMLRDLRGTGDPYHRQVADAVVRAYGGEEAAAKSIGKQYQGAVEGRGGRIDALKQYFSDVLAGHRIGTGKASPEDYGANLVRQMRNRSGEGDLTIPTTASRGGVNTFDQEHDLRPAVQLKDGTVYKAQGEEDHHGPAMERAFQAGKDLSGSKIGFADSEGNFYNRDQAQNKFGVRVSSDLFHEAEPSDLDRYNELMGQMKERLAQRDYEGFYKLQTETEAIKNRNPLKPGMPPTDDSVQMQYEGGNKYATVADEEPLRFRPTQAAIERIKNDVKGPLGKELSGGLQKTLQEKQNLLGKWWNPIAVAGEKTTPAQQSRVRDVLNREVNESRSFRFTLRTAAERNLYDTIRKNLADSADYRIAINEPVYRNGNPTPAGKDPYYYPTTTEPKVADIFRQNTDTAKIDKLSQDFIAHQLTHGYTHPEAEQNLHDIIDSFQGSALRSSSDHANFFNAARKAQGIPLPESWQRQDLMRNLEAYHRRLTADVSYYHNVETNPRLMAALGYKSDPWRNPVNVPGVENVAGRSAVDAVLGQLKGEHTTSGGRAEHAAETVATSLMLGPLTEIHKAFSSLAQVMTYSKNPMEAAQVIGHAIANIGDGWTKALETGYINKDASKASDVLNASMAAYERLRGLTKAIRNVYTLNGLTEHTTKSFLQAAGDYIIRSKVEMANQGDKGAQRLLLHLDPDYVVGKTYTGAPLDKMASEFANLIHGTKDARTLPSWMLHDNEVSAFFKLSSWNIAQTNNFMRNVVTPAVRDRNIAPFLMTTLGVTLGGAVIKELRERLAAKKGPIPSFNEMMSSSRGLKGNIPAAAYNWMSMASFAGFAGVLSTLAKVPADWAFKNTAGGATFPADEILRNTFNTAKNVVETLTNDPTANYFDVGTHALMDLFKSNIQFARIAIQQAADHGVGTENEVYKKALNDKLGELRRWKMVEGLPYEAQTGAEGNPYMNIGAKRFKQTQDINEALTEMGPLLRTIIDKYHNNPEIMLEKLKGLKQNPYETMPSLDDTPLLFTKYLQFLRNSQGNDAAVAHMQDYIRHKMINEAKGSLVP